MDPMVVPPSLRKGHDQRRELTIVGRDDIVQRQACGRVTYGRQIDVVMGDRCDDAIFVDPDIVHFHFQSLSR